MNETSRTIDQHPGLVGAPRARTMDSPPERERDDSRTDHCKTAMHARQGKRGRISTSWSDDAYSVPDHSFRHDDSRGRSEYATRNSDALRTSCNDADARTRI